MAFSKKKADPISAKARALNEQIAALESEIKRLDSQLARPTPPPAGETLARPAEKTVPLQPREPVFEEINRTKLTPRTEPESTELFNELGVRKYDLPALLQRVQNHFRGPATSNPRLINYLAAGGVHGLRPLRYEKRVARNRFIWLVVGVSIVLFGLFYILAPSWRH